MNHDSRYDAYHGGTKKELDKEQQKEDGIAPQLHTLLGGLYGGEIPEGYIDRNRPRKYVKKTSRIPEFHRDFNSRNRVSGYRVFFFGCGKKTPTPKNADELTPLPSEKIPLTRENKPLKNGFLSDTFSV